MAVIRITIKKKLEAGAYGQHNFIKNEFSSDYVVRTNAAFPSAHIEQWAHRIAVAESRLYPLCVGFEEANFRLVTPGLPANELGRRFRAEFADLKGTVAIAEGEMLAYPPVLAVFNREASLGRHGRLLMPHVLTTTEWNLYAQQRVEPLRFQHEGFERTAFSRELMAALQSSDDAYVMAAVEGDTEQSLRSIRSFFFYGFQAGTPKKKRKSKAATKRAAASKSADPKMPVEGVVYMLQAGQHFKIGKSINPNKRIGQLKTQLPHAITVVHIIRAAHPSQAESHWHRRFASRRLNGEWFDLTPEEVNEFKSVSEM